MEKLHSLKMKTHYDKLYSKDKSYWGEDPSPLSLILFSRFIIDRKNLTLLDLGCGQGPDTIYFAKKGFSVTAIDVSKTALSHLLERAKEENVIDKIKTIDGDMQKLELLPQEKFTALFSRMALQMIPDEERSEYLEKLKKKYPDSIHVHIIPISGACFGNDFICNDGLLIDAYKDWEVLHNEKVWTIGRARNKKGEPYLMREAWIIAKK